MRDVHNEGLAAMAVWTGMGMKSKEAVSLLAHAVFHNSFVMNTLLGSST